MKNYILFIIFFFLFQSEYSQEVALRSDTLRKDALNVFMIVSDYVKKEIPYVNYVRDIKEAGVYVISTSQATGSGGREYTYFFVGQHENAGLSDTLSFSANPDATQDEIREKEVDILKIGLMRYVAKTPLSKYLKVTFTEPVSETVSTDKWNSWVFRTRFNGFLDGQQSIKSKSLKGNFSASRVTDKWKTDLRARYNHSNDKFEIDEEVIESVNTSKSFDALVVKSISAHWSVGGSFEVESSTFNNFKLSTEFMPGIEYDIYP